MEIVLLGHMGRDEALADRLPEHKLHILGQWANPGLIEKAEASGGDFRVVESITDVESIADYVQSVEPDMFLTNFDDALAAGVVDAIRRRISDKRISDILLPCPDKSASRVEWDKFYLREIIDEIDPRYNPTNFMAKSSADVDNALAFFEDRNTKIALKPRNLTGGKGVKVQGKHFETIAEGHDYALQVLANKKQSGIEVQEKLEGHEFTLQIFTDGNTLIKPPATYDYPYREDGDEGPGTGGMGAFSMQSDEQLPFINQHDYDEAVVLMNKLLIAMKERGDDYKGVLYPTFFKTANGLKIVEVNARGGDPELINILDLLEDDVDFVEVLKQIAKGELTPEAVRFKKLASAMLYLVSPEYGYHKGPSYEFGLHPDIVRSFGCNVRFAAAKRYGENRFCSVGSSRTVGLSSLATTPWEARDNIHAAIQSGFDHPLPLHFRNQVAEKEYIESLRDQKPAM